MGWLRSLEAMAADSNFMPADMTFHSGHVIRSGYNYGRDVQGGLASNVIMSPMSWIMRNFTEADAIVEARRAGVWEYAEDHDLELRLARPNPFYGGGLLWRSTVLSYNLDGNAYWQKVRNVFGEIVGYWYIPHFRMEPKWPHDGSEFISHYEYTPLGGMSPIPLAVRDVVHFRQDALDPDNPRKGLGKLKPLLREVFTDEEAANFSATILRNMGVPGGVIAPKDGKALPTPDDVKEMKAFMKGDFSGDRRGEWLVLGSPTEIAQFGFDPTTLTLHTLRDVPEERVCAMLGVPAAVVGFGSGLQSTKVGATMKELRKEAWDSCIRPMQNAVAEQLTLQALPDYQAESHLHRYRAKFDISNFAASQEEERERTERLAIAVQSGMLRVDKAQEAAGYEVDTSQAVYLRKNNVVAIAAGDAGLALKPVVTDPPPAPAEPDPQSNGKLLDDVGHVDVVDLNRIREFLASEEGD